MFDLDDWTVVGGFAHNMCWYRRGECVVAATIDASTLFSMPNCNRLKDSVAFIIVAVPPTRIVTNFEANIFLVQEVIGRCELFLLKIFYSQVMTTITHKILLFPLLSWAHLSNTSQSKSEHSLLKWFFYSLLNDFSYKKWVEPRHTVDFKCLNLKMDNLSIQMYINYSHQSNLFNRFVLST